LFLRAPAKIGQLIRKKRERETPLSEWQVVFLVALYELCAGSLISRWEWYTSFWSWLRASRLCAYAIYFPCTDRIEPAVLPLTGINVE
jgi:hypothetical protein